MTTEKSNTPELRVRRLVELRWQREVIASWLAGSGKPAQSRPQLEEMFAQVSAELRALEEPSTGADFDASLNQGG